MTATVADAELAICMRFRGIRLGLRWSQPAFAAELGITRERLASYEYGRAPLRYDLAKRVCQRFEINQRWLATAKRPRSPYAPVPPDIDKSIDPRALFSEVYASTLQKPVEDYLTEQAAKLQCKPEDLEFAGTASLLQPEPEGDGWRVLHRAISIQMIAFAKAIPPEQQQHFFGAMVDAAANFIHQHNVKSDLKNALTVSSLKSISTGMRSEHLPTLLKRLNQVTSQRGKKSELAKILKVPAARVSEWLSGKKEPGGESTLQLLAWVQAEEAKQKSSGGASNTAGAKTRKRKSIDENPRSGTAPS